MSQAAVVQPVVAVKPAAAVRQTLQRKYACGANASALTGECGDCGRKRVLGVQTKLAVSGPGDAAEQDADRMADEVMRMPSSRSAGDAAQDRAAVLGGRQSGVTGTPPPTLGLIGGVPLEQEARAFMERRFGFDFRHVRVHTGPHASEAAGTFHALAFTLGRDIVFRDGAYRPSSPDGRRLIAHELAHVVQQDATPGAAGTILRAACPDECLECPPDGVVAEGCECLGDENPRAIVPVPVPVRIVRLDGASSEGTIRRGIRQANKTWRAAGIAVDAQIRSIGRADTEAILGTDERGRLRGDVQIEPEHLAINAESTRALLGLPTESGNEELSLPAGRTPHGVVVYYVPEFNSCGAETEPIGCAFSGTHGGRYFVIIEKRHQDVALAHELGHIWGNAHVEDKRNVMHPRPSRMGLTAEQIRTARRMLGLGRLRCLPEHGTAADAERIEEEQQIGQLLLLLVAGKWTGTVDVDGTPRDSWIEFDTPAADRIHGLYRYRQLDGRLAGGSIDGAVIAGRLDYDWKQTAGAETSGKGSLALTGINPPFRLAGRWGVGASRTNGGDWTLERE